MAHHRRHYGSHLLFLAVLPALPGHFLTVISPNHCIFSAMIFSPFSHQDRDARREPAFTHLIFRQRKTFPGTIRTDTRPRARQGAGGRRAATYRNQKKINALMASNRYGGDGGAATAQCLVCAICFCVSRRRCFSFSPFFFSPSFRFGCLHFRMRLIE